MLRSKVWGPHYWFFLFTVGISYPLKGNEVSKKKYYEFIHNFPLFIPDKHIGNDFSKLLDKYPVTPYLESRDMFLRWIHFIHNRINILLGKKEISFENAMVEYYDHYKEDKEIKENFFLFKRIYIYIITVFFFLVLAFLLYRS